MDADVPTALLGGLTPAAFMRRHWQRRPLLARGALPGIAPPVERAGLFALASREEVESRLVVHEGARWRLRHGPFGRRALPPLAQPGWTLLVQGVDTHDDAAHALLSRFRFVPDARLDDLMVSYATEGGGVGPHVDSYDVFLVQVQGRRRWRIGAVDDPALVPDVPLKLLARFRPTQEWVLEPGDVLYLPPGWGHDGIAEGGECITCSVGFRAPAGAELGREVLHRRLEADDTELPAAARRLYRDAGAAPTGSPARIPPALQAFAAQAAARWLAQPQALDRALGEWLSEPKPHVRFEPGEPLVSGRGLRLDRRTRMLYDRDHVFINGESYRAGGSDAMLMRRLADRRAIDARRFAGASAPARALLDEWAEAGWLHAGRAGDE